MALPASGGTITSAKTGPDGRYQIDGLAPATYRVDFDLRGFDRVRRNRVADVLLPNHPAWPLIVSDSGFQTRRIQASRAHVVPMVIRLEPGDIQNVPETETFERGCLCPVLFTHQGR